MARPRLHLTIALAASILIASFAGLLPAVSAAPPQNHSQPQIGPNAYVVATDANGNKVELLENRQPSLYTGGFGDCLGGDLVDISRFDAMYYRDNMTIIFHVAGTTSRSNESLMMLVAVYAYGQTRYQMIFDPCNANIVGLCPTNASIPFEASDIIPVGPADVASIPAIALSIPDFEGQAYLRVFANSTRQEVACFAAQLTNGNTLSHPGWVAGVMGVITLGVAFLSFLTAVYGDQLPVVRSHYAHSLSVFVMFAVFHYVFFSGALSLQWPSVLSGWWSNFAWTAGLIYTPSMQASINAYLGGNYGNTTVAGGSPGLGASSDRTGGFYRLSQVYNGANRGNAGSNVARRAPDAFTDILEAVNASRLPNAHPSLVRRSLENVSTGFDWYGTAVDPGMPLPGTFSGLPGTLYYTGITAMNAFTTALLWLTILIVVIAGLITLFKWSLEGMSRLKWIERDRLALFRTRWVAVTAMAVARILFVAFFMMVTLCLFQFAYRGPPGPTVLAVFVFLFFFVGVLGIAWLSVFYRLQTGAFAWTTDRMCIERRRVLRVIPWVRFRLNSTRMSHSTAPPPVLASFRVKRLAYTEKSLNKPEVWDDEPFLMRYGWLVARFRKSRWWFASVWLLYEFLRACFIGGGIAQPLAQVFGLLVLEFIALVVLISLKPFEGTRLNALLVYLLGFSKILTTGLSAAFYPGFGLPRIAATAIALVIVVIQGLLLFVLLVFVGIGLVSSYMSLTRNREEFHPRAWHHVRDKYLNHVDAASRDRAPSPALPPDPDPYEQRGPHFSVSSIRREPKIEDSDETTDMGDLDLNGSRLSFGGGGGGSGGGGGGITPAIANVDGSGSLATTRRASRAGSMHSTMSHSNLPYGARPHRASWTSRDFATAFDAAERRSSSAAVYALRNNSDLGGAASRSSVSLRDHHHRAHSRPRSVMVPTPVPALGEPSIKRTRPRSTSQSTPDRREERFAPPRRSEDGWRRSSVEGNRHRSRSLAAAAAVAAAYEATGRGRTTTTGERVAP